MNIQDAVRSGKLFRRKGHSTWYIPACNPIFSTDMVLATDWEVQEERRELSWEEIKAAISDNYSGLFWYKESEMKSQLGFKE
jgi:hypothetical protein